MAKFLWVGCGGALGSMLRFAMSGAVHRWLPASSFPVGTLSVNVVGCLAIGLLGGLMETRGALSPEVRFFLLLGLLGGFTTFSTFGYETLALLRGAEGAKAAINVLAHVLFGLGAVWSGGALARLWS